MASIPSALLVVKAFYFGYGGSLIARVKREFVGRVVLKCQKLGPCRSILRKLARFDPDVLQTDACDAPQLMRLNRLC